MLSSEGFLEKFIDNQRKAIKYHLTFAISMIGIGVIILLVGLFGSDSSGNDTLNTIISIGGTFVSALSSFPIKEIINLKEKIGVFETLKITLHNASESELVKMDNLIWKTIERTATG